MKRRAIAALYRHKVAAAALFLFFQTIQYTAQRRHDRASLRIRPGSGRASACLGCWGLMNDGRKFNQELRFQR